MLGLFLITGELCAALSALVPGDDWSIGLITCLTLGWVVREHLGAFSAEAAGALLNLGWPAGSWFTRLPQLAVYGPRTVDSWVRSGGRRPPDPGTPARAVLDGVVATNKAWSWLPLQTVVIICEPADVIRTETHDGRQRLHSDTGPAVVWPDGTAEHHIHGVRVPKSLADGRWSVRRIHAEPNSEVRRIAIERMGWTGYLEKARLRLVAAAPDPANEPHELLLYELPRALLADARLLVMTNGSPDRSGQQRRYAELVPSNCRDPLNAAAWQHALAASRLRLPGGSLGTGRRGPDCRLRPGARRTDRAVDPHRRARRQRDRTWDLRGPSQA